VRSERRRAVIERLLAVHARGEPEPACTESRVPSDRYTSAARLEDELRVLFRTMPLAVGRASDLPEPGAFFTHDAAGVPILVTRDGGGHVHAMLNVCRHRGTRLVCEASGSAKSFVCQYHAWTYDLCGRLGHVPMARCFPSLAEERDESALAPLPCEVRHGFVWVVPSRTRMRRRPGEPAPIDAAAWLGDFDEDLAAFGLESHVVFARSTQVRAANWKLVMDAFLEGYHVKSLHQRTLARFFGDAVVVDASGPHVRSVGARRSLGELAGAGEDALRAHTTVFYTLFPNSVLVFHPELVSHLALFPRGQAGVEFVHTMLAPREPASDGERAGWQKTWGLIDGQVFAKEDLAIAESIQSVLHADANATFRIGSLEHPIRMFHDAIDRAIAARSVA
jgi:phenylpropionate dioxygenase-like ring-hydroxylating dioxygenase large terminal subunit